MEYWSVGELAFDNSVYPYLYAQATNWRESNRVTSELEQEVVHNG